MVGGMGVGEGTRVGVLEGRRVGEDVGVKTSGGEGRTVDVAETVAAWVAVVKSVAKASIVSARSVLIVAVADPPVFGIMRSGS
jgi:hypothetical protein